MYFFHLFSLLYLLKQYSSNNPRLGIDERISIYPNKIVNDISFEKILQIQENVEKIEFLKSNNVCIEDKLYEIGNRNIPKPFNMINGGLFNDWDFDFFENV